MEENQIFLKLWRINAIIIALTGVLAILILIFAAVEILSDIFRNRNVSNIVNIGKDHEIKENIRLGYLIDINNSTYAIINVISDQDYQNSYYKKSSDSVRNYLFVNTQTNEGSYLLSHNDYLITEKYFIYENPSTKNEIPKSMVYEIIMSDTDGNKRLTKEDKKTIAISDISGKNYKELIFNIDTLVGIKQIDSSYALCVYQSDNKYHSAKINLSTLKIANDNVLKSNH